MIYEVRVTIANHRRAEYKEWIRSHVAQILHTGCFTHATVEEVLDGDRQTTTFVMRYACDTKQDFQQYLDTYAPKFRAKGLEKFGDTMQATRCLLEAVTL